MTDNWLSDCHQAPVKVVGADEGTNHWECIQCGQGCNAHQTDNTIDHIHISKVGGTHCLECGQQLPQSTIDEQGASATPKLAKQPSVSKSITRYLLVSRNDIGDFMKSVDTSLKEGWQCQGGVSVIHWTGNYASTRYYQAMIKVIDLATPDKEPK